MQQVFGAKLVDTPISDDMEVLPSPEQLKYKILIKCHKPCGAGFAKVANASDDASCPNIFLCNTYLPISLIPLTGPMTLADPGSGPRLLKLCINFLTITRLLLQSMTMEIVI